MRPLYLEIEHGPFIFFFSVVRIYGRVLFINQHFKKKLISWKVLFHTFCFALYGVWLEIEPGLWSSSYNSFLFFVLVIAILQTIFIVQ